MKKAIKLLLGIAVLCGLALGALFWKLDSFVEAFKPQLEEQLSKSIGSPTSLGKIKVSLLPQPGFEVTEVSIKGSSGASVMSLGMHAELAALLKGKIAFSNITIEGLRATLVKSKDGAISIEGITPAKRFAASTHDTPAPQENSASAQPKDSTKRPASDSAKGAPALEIKEVTITDSFITFRDETAVPAQRITLADIRGSLTDINPKGAAKGTLRLAVQGGAAADITLSGEFGNPVAGFPLDVKLALQKVELAPLVTLLSAYGMKIENVTLENHINLSATIKAVPGGVRCEGELDATAARIRSEKQFAKEPGQKFLASFKSTIGLDTSVAAEELRLTLGNITVDLPFSISPTRLVTANIKTVGLSLPELNSFVPLLSPYKLSGAIDSQFEVKVEKQPGGESAPRLTGNIALIEVGALLGSSPENPDAGAVPVEKLSGAISLEGDTVKIQKLSGQLAGQELAIEGKVINLAKPTFALVLSSPELRAEPILKALNFENPSLSSSYLKGVKIAATYRSEQADGLVKLTSGEALVTDVPMNSVSLNMDITPARIVLQPSTLGLFGGSVTTDATYSRGDDKSFLVGLKGSAMDAVKLSAVALKDSSVKIRGTLSSLGVSLSGNASNATSSLSGSVRATVEKGAITGVNILGQTLGKLNNIPGIGGALSAYIPPQYQTLMQSDETPFDQLLVSSELGGGRINLSPVDLKHSAYEVNGTGWTAFNGEMVIHGKLKITREMATSMTLKEPKLKLLLDPDGGLIVPILISKKDGHIIVIPDLEDLLKRAARNTAKEAVSRELEKVAPGLGGAAKAIDSLFK